MGDVGSPELLSQVLQVDVLHFPIYNLFTHMCLSSAGVGGATLKTFMAPVLLLTFPNLLASAGPDKKIDTFFCPSVQ